MNPSGSANPSYGVLTFSQDKQPYSTFLSLHLLTIVVVVLLGLAVYMIYWFVTVFTVELNPKNPPDEDTSQKISQMIRFCYIFMSLTLGVAILPLIFIMLLPQVVVYSMYNDMLDSPFALVVGCVHDNKPEDLHWEIVCQSSDPYLSEWLVSIGGLVLTPDLSRAVPSTAGTSTAPAPPTIARASKTSTKNHASKPKKVELSDADPYVPPPWPDLNLTSYYWNFPPAVIHGGITVPLYFIIVALVGGSISLTRRVPEFQRQFLDESKPFAASEMREHLVLQILQFLSAPLLAIAGYILFTPAGPTTSVPLAFVAGFSSETVLTLITSSIRSFEPQKRE